jgi:hypothetical protein
LPKRPGNNGVGVNDQPHTSAAPFARLSPRR